MRRPTTLRVRFLRNVLTLVLVITVAMLTIVLIVGQSATGRLSTRLIEQAQQRSESELRMFFDPVQRAALIGADWIERRAVVPDGLVDAAGRPTEAMLTNNRWLAELIATIPHVSSVLVADERGFEYLLLRTGDGWLNRVTRPGTDVSLVYRWTDDDPQPRRAPADDRRDYDPARRAWFRGAMAAPPLPEASTFAARASGLAWTAPYTLLTTGDPGITASARVRRDGVPDAIIAVDVTLVDLSRFTMTMTPSSMGEVFVASDRWADRPPSPGDPYLVGVSHGIAQRMPGESWRAALGRTSHEVGDPVSIAMTEAISAGIDREAWQAWAALPFAERIAHRDVMPPVPFTSEGRRWWAQAHLFGLSDTGSGLDSGSDSVWVAVAVPEQALLFGLPTIRLAIVLVILALLPLIIWRVAALARRFADPMEELMRRSDRIARGDFAPNDPLGTDLVEVRRLSEAQDRMRIGLESLMKLEGDLQLARQIQQRTFPAVLPRLAGFDLAASSVPADATGGDTYDVVAREDGRLVLLLADATGHGVGPALSVTQVHAMLRMATLIGVDVARLARLLNRHLCGALPQGRFITAWIAELDADGLLRSFSAGQAPLLHVHASDGRVESLSAETFPLGVQDPLPDATPVDRRLDRGDLFLVLSDGIYEARNGAGVQFGVSGVEQVLGSMRRGSAAAIVEAIGAAVDRHTDGAPAEDDRTMVVIRRL